MEAEDQILAGSPDPTDPYAELRLRAETCPVARSSDDIWHLYRHVDCVRLLVDTRSGMRTSDGRLPSAWQPSGVGGEWLLYQDRPVHTRLRRNVAQLFTPGAAERWRAKLTPIADALFAGLKARSELDVVADVAVPVRAALVCELMGIPEQERPWFGPTALAATRLLAGETLPEGERERARASSERLAGYLQELIDRRRPAPVGDDVICALLRAEQVGLGTSPNDVSVQTIGHLLSGFETVGFLANAVIDLVGDRVGLARLYQDPSLIPAAVEECLRYSGPIGSTIRVLHEPDTFSGQPIPAGAPVEASLWAANRDPDTFDDPDRFDIDRHANAHLSFGAGNHVCIGQHFARVESQVVLTALLHHLDELELLDDRIEWTSLPLRVPARLRLGFRPIERPAS